MAKKVIIGIIVLSLVYGLLDACCSGVKNMYDSFVSTHEEVLEAIDKGDLRKAKKTIA